MWNSTDIELSDPGGVIDSELGSLAVDTLPAFIFNFSADFVVPEALSPFDLLASGREVVDVAMFRCRGTYPMTVAVAVCTDVVVVAEVRSAQHDSKQYVLVAEPGDRATVTATVDPDDECAFHLQCGSHDFLLRVPTPEECNEWTQILCNPGYTGSLQAAESANEELAAQNRSSSRRNRRGPKPRGPRPKAGKKIARRHSSSASDSDVADQHESQHHGGQIVEADEHRESDEDDNDNEEHDDARGEARMDDSEGYGEEGAAYAEEPHGAVLHCAMSKDEAADLMEEYGKCEGL
jgi:hypothetical protein